MQVVATAGHAGHGKSALVRALTGRDPASGPAWTRLPSGTPLALLDAPGDERSMTAALAAMGQAAAVMMVVAADEGWKPCSEDHLAAAGALGIRHGLLVVTRSDLADPAPAVRQARARIARSSLGAVETVIVGGLACSGTGEPAAWASMASPRVPAAAAAEAPEAPAELVAALDRLVARLPAPATDGPVRVWAGGTGGRTAGDDRDRLVVTGTLTAGTVRTGDRLLLGDRRATVTGIQDVSGPVVQAQAAGPVELVLEARHQGLATRAGRPARPAGRDTGIALVTPGAWTETGCVDVRLGFGEATGRLSRLLVLHLGAAAVPVRMRPLGPDTARLVLNTRLPLHVGDRGLLRDPVRRAVAAASVLDVRPPVLTGRGAAAARGRELAGWPDRPGGEPMLRRHGVLRPAELVAMGCGVPGTAERPDPEWVADPEHWAWLADRLREEVARHAAGRPLSPGLSLEAARLRLGLPSRRLVARLAGPPLRVADGRIHVAEPALPRRR